MSDSSKNTILVTGATGQQGGATARQLLAKGWPVRTITRDPSKESAQTLGKQGIEVLKADFNAPASLEEALGGVYGVFSIQTFTEGVEAETEQGKALINAAQAAGVKHFVYSSVGGADRKSGVPHFESKWKVEQHLNTTDLTTTVLRPVFFMDNFNKFMRPQMQDGKLVLMLAMESNVKLQMISVDDIGAFAALAFENPQEYAGKSLEIAGDELTGPEIAAAFGRLLGQPVGFVQQPLEQVRQYSEENAVMFQWFNEHGYQADLPAVRRLYPAVQTFEQYLQLNKSNWS